jgi:hypothetical protein
VVNLFFSQNSLAQTTRRLLVYRLHQMPINIHCDVDAAVAELALDVFGVFSLGNQEAGVRVPEVMKSDARQPGSLKVVFF